MGKQNQPAKKVYWPYSGITIQNLMFTSKSYSENFDYNTIGIQRRISASFPGQNVRCIFLNLPPKIKLEVIQFIFIPE